MAEECIKSPTTSEIIKTDEGNSAGKSRSSRSGRTPHYLRAPGRSCHEHCKYGGTQIFRTKSKYMMRGKMSRKLPDELLLAEDVAVPGSAQKSMIKLNILSNLESQTYDIANVVKQEGQVPEHAGVKSMAQGEKKSEVELKSSRSTEAHSSYLHKIAKPGMASSGTKHVSLEASAMLSSETYSRLMKTKREPKPMSVPGSSGHSSNREKNSITTSRDTRTYKVAAKNLPVSSTTSNSLEFSSRSPSMRLRQGIAGKVISPLKNQNKKQNSTKNAEVQIPKEVAVQEKTLYVINEKNEHAPSEFTSITTTIAVDDQNGSAIKMSPESLSLPQNLSLPKCPSPTSHEEEFHESSNYTDNEGEGCCDSGHGESESSVRAGPPQRPTQDRTKRDSRAVVGTQAESSSLRRLNIKRGKAFGENQNPKADARRRIFKRREEIKDGKNSSSPSSIKITLKHQDVREKKGQKLFNNMIEETASQLVKTRKSKVKALVGAFETVISLQDTKTWQIRQLKGMCKDHRPVWQQSKSKNMESKT